MCFKETPFSSMSKHETKIRTLFLPFLWLTKDIRKYFGAVPSSSSTKSKPSSSSNKKQPNGTGGKRKRRLDDDEEDFQDGGKRGKTSSSKPAKMKKTAVIYDSGLCLVIPFKYSIIYSRLVDWKNSLIKRCCHGFSQDLVKGFPNYWRKKLCV